MITKVMVKGEVVGIVAPNVACSSFYLWRLHSEDSGFHSVHTKFREDLRIEAIRAVINAYKKGN